MEIRWCWICVNGANVSEKSEAVRYLQQCGWETGETQVRWYPNRFTHVNLKGFTYVSKKIHLRLLNNPPCSLNNSIRLIVVLISHTGTLSLAPHLLYVFIIYVVGY
jgi:hypothetical protein